MCTVFPGVFLYYYYYCDINNVPILEAMDHSVSAVPIVLVEPKNTVNTSEQQQNGLNGHAIYTDNSNEFSKNIRLPHLPNRDPIDIQFKDITYTVKLGFNKGMFICIDHAMFYDSKLIAAYFAYKKKFEDFSKFKRKIWNSMNASYFV